MRYFSMFTGIGGFELGIHNAYRSEKRGIQEDTEGVTETGSRLLAETRENTSASTRRPSQRSTDGTDQRPLCIGYSEIDKYAIATYERQFYGHTNYGDATTINERELPDFDLLVGGFPCQSFSVAGKRGGFNDTRGTLFFDVARILSYKRPGHFVLENVKGLLSHDTGKTFATILRVLADMGYRVEWQVLNSKNFGVPQNRERVYIVGHLRDGSCGKVFPITGNNRTDTKAKRPQTANTLTANYFKGPAANRPLVEEGEHQHDTDEQQWGTQTAADFRERKLDALGRMMPVHRTRRMIRKLTPIECERLQGFPDNWTQGSDTQRYKQCGNAVTTNVVQAVMERLNDH